MIFICIAIVCTIICAVLAPVFLDDLARFMTQLDHELENGFYDIKKSTHCSINNQSQKEYCTCYMVIDGVAKDCTD